MNTPSTPRRYLSRDDRRGQLLDAALDVVAYAGAAALSLRAVAERAGVAHRMVSYAFGTKDALVAALLRRESQRTLSAVWSAPLTNDPLPAAVAAALSVYAVDLDARPAAHLAVAELTAAARGDQLDAVRAEAALVREAIVERLEEWRTMTGAAWTTSVEVVATALLITADGLATWWLSGRDHQDAEPVIGVLSSGFAALAGESGRS